MGPGFSPLKDKKFLSIIFLFLLFSISIPLIAFFFREPIKQIFFGKTADMPEQSVLPKIRSTVNRKTGQGEFVVSESSVAVVSSTPIHKQVIVEGNYSQIIQKAEAKVSLESSNSPPPPPALLFLMPKTASSDSKILIQLEMIVKGKTLYSTVLSFNVDGNQDTKTFKSALPYYYKDFSIRFSDVLDKTLLSQDVKL